MRLSVLWVFICAPKWLMPEPHLNFKSSAKVRWEFSLCRVEAEQMRNNHHKMSERTAQIVCLLALLGTGKWIWCQSTLTIQLNDVLVTRSDILREIELRGYFIVFSFIQFESVVIFHSLSSHESVPIETNKSVYLKYSFNHHPPFLFGPTNNPHHNRGRGIYLWGTYFRVFLPAYLQINYNRPQQITLDQQLVGEHNKYLSQSHSKWSAGSVTCNS